MASIWLTPFLARSCVKWLKPHCWELLSIGHHWRLQGSASCLTFTPSRLQLQYQVIHSELLFNSLLVVIFSFNLFRVDFIALPLHQGRCLLWEDCGSCLGIGVSSGPRGGQGNGFLGVVSPGCSKACYGTWFLVFRSYDCFFACSQTWMHEFSVNILWFLTPRVQDCSVKCFLYMSQKES